MAIVRIQVLTNCKRLNDRQQKERTLTRLKSAIRDANLRTLLPVEVSSSILGSNLEGYLPLETKADS
jgi:hypothetical protein